jgi:hypothetical protein
MIWCLDFHAPYRCRHAGACCRAGWTIPFEDGTIAARDMHGACTFLDGSARLCSIHRQGGIMALPVTCRMFPRIVLHDVRGTFVSLSHFCPTAASLLFDGTAEATIVEAPEALAHVGELDGLDARGEWPPLLRARVLMDADSYSAWERHAVSLLTRDTLAPCDSLAELEDITARIVTWVPGSGRLEDVVHAAFTARTVPSVAGEVTATTDTAVKRWLAARLFGTWHAYQGDGLAATIGYLRACLQVFDAELTSDGSALEAIRRSDLRVLHAAGGRSLKR